MGFPGQFTHLKAIGSKDSEWKEIVKNPDVIKRIYDRSDDYGRSFTSDLGLKPIQFLSLIGKNSSNGKYVGSR